MSCIAVILFVFTKWVHVLHNASLKCSKTVFSGISHAGRLVFQVFHGIYEPIREG